MNIVFMGTPDFAAGVLKAILKAGYTVTGAVTQPDKRQGRKMEITPCAVKQCAVSAGIRVFQPEKLKTPGAADEIRKMQPDVIVVAAFGQIVPEEILNIPRLGCINVHASLLPSYRGAAPIQHVILDGLEETGVTIMRMNKGLDTGDIVAQAKIAVSADETGGSLFEKLSSLGSRLLAETLPEIENGTAVYTPQPKESPTPYARMISKEMGKIDWHEDAASIERKIRAFSPWPSAFTSLDGHTLKIWKGHVEKPELTGEAGKIVRQDARGIYIETGKGILFPEIVQLEGKKKMPVTEFLRGYVIRNNVLG
ncbi:MAG TPA: methionyl-tRNA formyltransferase [Lachnospiraceae bacterium]|nr:methionyl-tRNA formyltransferase [Lachnospiraceae bacterium]